MTRLEDFVAGLADRLPRLVADAETGEGLGVLDVAIRLPIEARIDVEGLHACAPRGRLATGFDPPHGHVRLELVVTSPGGAS